MLCACLRTAARVRRSGTNGEGSARKARNGPCGPKNEWVVWPCNDMVAPECEKEKCVAWLSEGIGA